MTIGGLSKKQRDKRFSFFAVSKQYNSYAKQQKDDCSSQQNSSLYYHV